MSETKATNKEDQLKIFKEEFTQNAKKKFVNHFTSSESNKQELAKKVAETTSSYKRLPAKTLVVLCFKYYVSELEAITLSIDLNSNYLREFVFKVVDNEDTELFKKHFLSFVRSELSNKIDESINDSDKAKITLIFNSHRIGTPSFNVNVNDCLEYKLSFAALCESVEISLCLIDCEEGLSKSFFVYEIGDKNNNEITNYLEKEEERFGNLCSSEKRKFLDDFFTKKFSDHIFWKKLFFLLDHRRSDSFRICFGETIEKKIEEIGLDIELSDDINEVLKSLYNFFSNIV